MWRPALVQTTAVWWSTTLRWGDVSTSLWFAPNRLEVGEEKRIKQELNGTNKCFIRFKRAAELQFYRSYATFWGWHSPWVLTKSLRCRKHQRPILCSSLTTLKYDTPVNLRPRVLALSPLSVYLHVLFLWRRMKKVKSRRAANCLADSDTMKAEIHDTCQTCT